jgi:hypothetical protein
MSGRHRAPEPSPETPDGRNPYSGADPWDEWDRPPVENFLRGDYGWPESRDLGVRALAGHELPAPRSATPPGTTYGGSCARDADRVEARHRVDWFAERHA